MPGLANARPLLIVNSLTRDEHPLTVPEEETLSEIAARYAPYNRNSVDYIWKYLGRPLDMSKTLDGNGIKDDRQTLASLELPAQEWGTPKIVLVYV
ncbi:hypothetical protein KIPB_010028 [Kipferlia bialata]|uniref:Ubiquitin-like domain-containing protein n=1 Tax=Kipferlia bialata TaxID=797122 RepID=A0A9K3D4S7_9EUKA|nr:hypothetical protein KIPB_010028 [Kipferlia bialata]|eukprot:g10028.t1